MWCGQGLHIESSGTHPAMTKATYYFRFYLARAVEHAGMGDRYLSLLQPWHDMALGLTTWAEQLDQLVTGAAHNVSPESVAATMRLKKQKAHPLGECALKAVYRGQLTTA